MPASLPALGICLEEYEYPYPVEFLPIFSDLQSLKMAYMDIPPDKEPNGKTVVLFHGKAFGCYLEIDRAVLAGRPHTTCGGRPLNDDIVDLLFTLMVGGVDGPHISDGVDQATQPATRSFPYLPSPNPNPPPVTPPFALPPVPAQPTAS
jgi:hypothetical protein